MLRNAMEICAQFWQFDRQETNANDLSSLRVENADKRAQGKTMLSQKTRYAIRAMQHLSDRYGQGPVQLSEIAVAQNIPPKFLTVILSELARSGLVASQRGKDGGYWLGVSPIDISYGDLIRIMRGSLALVPCASRYAHEKCKNCVEEDDCRTRALMLQVRDKTADLLDGIRLSDRVDTPSLLEAAE
jgi:Rrf2 family protein